MRSLFSLLAVFAAAVALVVLGRVNAGYVLFVYPPWRVEFTMLAFAIAAVACFLILYALVRLLGQAVSLPTTVRAYRARRRRDRAHGALASAPEHSRREPRRRGAPRDAEEDDARRDHDRSGRRALLERLSVPRARNERAGVPADGVLHGAYERAEARRA